ncbi:MAG: hypothetical protein HY075_08355 [Deltaproteobacteria bacterium]|nr:hypothetical protein [Deltaproteobacteria bacterium]
MTTGIVIETLFWTAMTVLVAFLAVRVARKAQHQHDELEEGLGESFERHKDDRAA